MEDLNFEQALQALLPASRIRTRYIDRATFGADAGFYYLLPKVVVQPVSEKEVAALFRFSQQHKIPMVFRCGGTSLSGQSITDGLLVDLSQYWNRIVVEESGLKVRVQPGITGGMVNAHLKRFSRKIGPDPSSINAAMMGGILSNNSSGMCCGVTANAYHTTTAIRFVLPDGKAFDTGCREDYERFEAECPRICGELDGIRSEILANAVLHEKIRRKYRTKNTVGYSLNAFLDHKHPLDILGRLLIGGEGTLAFISEAVLETIPDFRYKSTALLYFPDLESACKAIIPLKESDVSAAELMDRSSLRAVENIGGMPEIIRSLPETAAALLVEFQESDESRLQEKVDRFLSYAPGLTMLSRPVFTTDKSEQAFLWNVRKGLFPSVGAVRKSGTTVILEDIAFPVEALGAGILGLQKLFKQFAYDNAIIFGHVKDGNIHFVITQPFDSPAEINRYDGFIRAVVELVVNRHQGTLKGEHGTGRNMSPFVEAEWGSEAYGFMKRLKACIDPDHLLNPGVIINEDPETHIRNLKKMPAVEAEVDKCIECGYCERDCPSRNLTMTPRRRIVARRELKNLQAAGDDRQYRILLKEYRYDGLSTCAVDGLCASACPVDINTGDLVKRLRKENHSRFSGAVALLVARNFRLTEWSAKGLLKGGFLINRLFGKSAMGRLTGFFRQYLKGFPLWTAELGPPPRMPDPVIPAAAAGRGGNIRIIYFPACISRLLGPQQPGARNILDTMLSVSEKAGIQLILPKQLTGTCCGQIFSSKGFAGAYRETANQIVRYLWSVSEEGKLPIITDISSCAFTFHHLQPVLTGANQLLFDRMKILDSVEYLHDLVLPRAGNPEKKGSIALHPVCSLRKMKTEDKFIRVAKHFAKEVTVPLQAGCCGMAGDRGFLFPELTSSATAPESSEIKNEAFDGYYSSAKTCEMAMSAATKRNYESILFLVDEAME